MAQVVPPYGTLYYNGLEPSAGDKRSWGDEGAGTAYTTATDASFADGRCHNWTVANETSQIFGALSECDTAGNNYIELAHGEELRYYAEDESTFNASTTLVNDVIWSYRPGSNSICGYRVVLASLKIYVRWFLTDNDGVETVTSDYEISAASATPTYNQIEWTTRRYDDGGTTKLELKGYVGGVLKETITRTPVTSTIFRASVVAPTLIAITDKGASRNYKIGRIHVSWNNGSITRSDQQLWTTWAPTVIHQYPTSDVTSPDEWSLDGDATDAYKNVDDDPYVVTTGNTATSSTTKKELLLGWPAVGTLTGLVVPVLNYQDQRSDATSTNPKIQAICKNGSATYKRLTEQNNVSNAHGANGAHNSNVFITDPDSAAWSETSVDDNDFGLDKPASGAASAATVSQIWRYVLHGGNQVSAPASGGQVHSGTLAGAAAGASIY